MERFQKIVCHETYKQTYEKLQELEKDREFCGHDMEHFLSVARISYLMVLEKNLDIPKDIIYATAFLHDMGRADQYEKGISHDEAGRRDFKRLWLYSRRKKNHGRYDLKSS